MSPVSTFLDDPSNVTQLRGLAWLLLSDTGHVVGVTRTDDSGGGVTESPSSGSDVPCRLRPLGGGEDLTADRIDDRTTHLITIPASTAVTASNDFAITGKGTFFITAVRKRTHQVLLDLEVVPKT